MFFQLFLYFMLCLILSAAVLELYAGFLRCAARLPRPLPGLSARLSACVLGGGIFVLPFWGLDFFSGWAFTPVNNSLEEALPLLCAFLCPFFAYVFFYCRHMARLKELGYFLPVERL